jgi:uncharacterized protein YkwD
MNLIDLLLAFVILLGLWGGWRRGFVLAAVEVLALLVSLVVAFIAYRFPAEWLEQQWPWLGVWAQPISFAAVFVLTHLLVGALTGSLVTATSPRVHRHVINRFFGLAPGFVSGLINATVAALVLTAIPLADGWNRAVRDSVIARSVAQPAEWLESQLAPIFDPAIRRTLQGLTVQPDSPRTIALRFKTDRAQPRPDLEARMLDLINQERAKAGLKPLTADPELAEVARAHSRDMLARGYFSHVTPEGGKASDRARKAGASYLLMGENLAYAHTLSVAHQGLMNSPGHRANILRPHFGRVGIGVLDAGAHGLMITQNFRN